MTSANMQGVFELSAGRLLLDGTPSVLLCSSVFPFRIPSEQWAHRLDLVRDSGYRMIDLYVHWGFHEPRPGQIDFSSPERDLRRFLDLAAERSLLVMARPGPYICSETDGGGLPWWLHGDAPDAPAALRTSDPDYLGAVERWFGAVMPILAEMQVTRGGSVALVQIENELDFFDCPDPEAYMAHLARSARAHGIDVPLIACAGQGELAGASGDAPGTVPTVNLYPDDAAASFDEETRRYAQMLAERGLPLMVTETNRAHRTLRREILAGARLVAPYLQASGFDHLVLPSAGNWGDPGNLMTHDYDFGGCISPDGRRMPEYDEAVALGATLAAWGERLATARSQPLPTDRIDGIATGGALALDGGGILLGPAELIGLDTPVRVAGIDAVVPAGTCPFWALEVPLHPWGAQGVLDIATAELVGVERTDGVLVLTFEGGPESFVALTLPAAGGAEELRRTGPGERSSRSAFDPVRLVLRERGASLADPEPVPLAATGRTIPLAETLEGGHEAAGTEFDPAPGLRGAEALGLADGRVRAELDLSAAAQEVILLGAADLVRLTLDGVDHGVHVAHGAPLDLPLAPGTRHRLRVDVEIWGRANFDEARRPALRLGAGRGAGTVLEVRGISDVTDLWEVRELPDRRTGEPLVSPPLRELGGWSSTNPGSWTLYARRLPLPGGGERAALRLQGLVAPVWIAVQDGHEQLVVPEAPVVLLPEGEGSVEVRVRAPHVPGGLLASIELLTTAVPELRSLRTTTEAQLAARVQELADGTGGDPSPQPAGARPDESLPTRPAGPVGSQPVASPSVGPLRVGAGAPVLLQLDRLAGDGGELLELDGEDVEVTVISGGRRVSRHVLGRPAVAGGDARRSWVPTSWATDDTFGPVLLVESMAPGGGMFRGAKRARTDR